MKLLKGKLITSILLLAAVLIGLTACQSETAVVDSEPPQNLDMSNPASKNCVDQGFDLEIRTLEAGEYGVCVFSDGSECEEWAFFRGECQQGDFNPAFARDQVLLFLHQQSQFLGPAEGTVWVDANVADSPDIRPPIHSYVSGDWVMRVARPQEGAEEAKYVVRLYNVGNGFLWDGAVNAEGNVAEIRVVMPR